MDPLTKTDPNNKLFGKIIEEEHAYIELHDSLDLIMKEHHHVTAGRCDFQFAKEKFLTQRLAFAFPKDNPWAKKFNEQ